ncbi:MAG: SEC-C domain-containing protein [Pirellulales bacterium]|nr:SEC-C domain-containing protein [Pirellulales bacterium]
MARKPKKTKKTKEPKKVPVPRKKLDPSLPVYQLKIAIDGIDPSIWRRVQVENYHLGALHEVILELFDWYDDQSHVFYRPWLGRSRRHGEIWDRERKVRLSDILAENYERFVYVYFGDLWYHSVEIEATLPIEPGARYPRCLGGERAAPDEDCGGPKKWQSLIKAARDLEQSGDRPEPFAPGVPDPEVFDRDETARRLYGLRRRLARDMPPSGTSMLSVEDDVCVKPGVVHPEYPDLPLGGWAGTVIAIGYLTPRMYRIEWTPETLALAHPVYAKRCHRDGFDPEEIWLEEDQLVADPGGPVRLEEPVNLQTRPLSPENPEDRVRMIFGVTTDERVPAVSQDTLETYRQYLAQNLNFPLAMEIVSDFVDDENCPVTALSLCELSQDSAGLEVEVSGDADLSVMGLDQLVCPNNADPHASLLQDYRLWFVDFDRKSFDLDEDEDEDEEDEEVEDEEEKVDPRDLGPSNEDMDDEVDADDDFDENDNKRADGASEMPAPLTRGETIGRNEPCPCGSGKKYKQCCMKKEA